MVLYFSRLWDTLVHIGDKGTQGDNARRFVGVVLAGFVPAMILGVLVHDVLTTYLFNPWVVCVMLVLGGCVMLWLESGRRPPARLTDVDEIDWRLALKIGAIQCIAMIPGVSRSGATIMGALWLGVGRKAAAEFSFFLALPTMAGAVTYSLYKQRDYLQADDLLLIATGTVTAFVVALLVVRWLVGFVSRRTFRPFAWYRIGVGTVGLLALAVWG